MATGGISATVGAPFLRGSGRRVRGAASERFQEACGEFEGRRAVARSNTAWNCQTTNLGCISTSSERSLSRKIQPETAKLSIQAVFPPIRSDCGQWNEPLPAKPPGFFHFAGYFCSGGVVSGGKSKHLNSLDQKSRSRTV